MPTMVREAWTDERLDDLTKHMDRSFREVRADLREVRAEIHQLRVGLDAVKGEVGGTKGELAELREAMGELRGEMRAGLMAINRTLQIAGGLIGVMFVGLMGLIGTQL